MCVVLVPNIGISTSISNTTQIRPQHFRKVMCFHWECAWCQCQILVLAPAYPTLHNIRPQTFGNFMCVHWECVWCQCHIQVLAPVYPTIYKYAHSTSETSCVSTGNVRGASTKYWYQHQHIQHYTNTPTVHMKFHVCLLGMCVVLVPNIGISTSISNTTHIRHSTLETSCVSTGNVRGAIAKYWYQHQHIQQYTNTPTDLRKLHVCPLGMCVVLVPNIGISTSIFNTTQIRKENFRNFMCVHWQCARWLVPNIGISTSISNTTRIRPQIFTNFMCVLWECAWCQCLTLVLAPAYPILHTYAHSSSETSCVSTGNVRGASAKYWYQHQHIEHYSYTSQHLRNFMCVHWECAWCYFQILVLAPAYPTLHIYVTALQKLHVCPLGMCVVLLPNMDISTSISNYTHIRHST